MSTSYPAVKDFSMMDSVADVCNWLELRMENDVNGNPVYIGYNKTPNAGTAAETWFIVKITYDGTQSPTRQQLPNNGTRFVYSWDSRATYFA